VLVAALNALLGEFLIDLAERRPKDEAFLYGWLKARVLEPA
jgi:Co/Zn/Cd efflux system component